MKHNLKWAVVAALALSPAAALAQHAAPHAAPAPTSATTSMAPTPAAPSVAPRPAPEPFPGAAVADEDMWFDDDLFAFGPGDDLYMHAGDGDGSDMGSPGDGTESLEQEHGPGGERRVIVRRMTGGPGAMHGRGIGLHPGMGTMRHRLGMRLASLDLSDSQRDKLRDLHEAQVRKGIQRRADMQLGRMDLHRLMRADKPDPSAVNAQIEKLARLHADGLKSAFATQQQARAVLTAEQWKQLHTPMLPGAGMQHEPIDTPDGHPRR